MIRGCGHSALPCFGDRRGFHTRLRFQCGRMWQKSFSAFQKVGRWAVMLEKSLPIMAFDFLVRIESEVLSLTANFPGCEAHTIGGSS